MRRLVVVLALAACGVDEVSGPPDSPDAGPDPALALTDEVGRMYGRFGVAEDVSIAPDRRVMLVAVRDHPSTCLCDRERGFTDRGTGVALVVPPGERPLAVTYLIEEETDDHQVAAGRRHLAVATGRRLRIWRRDREQPPAERTLPDDVVELGWLGERLVVVTRAGATTLVP